MKKKPTLEDLGLDAPSEPIATSKKSIEQIANEVDSVESERSINCRKCTKLIHRHASVCAYCKTPVLPDDVIQPIQLPPIRTKKCQYCMTSISMDASKCPNCQEWLVKRNSFGSALGRLVAIFFLCMVILCSGISFLSYFNDSGGSYPSEYTSSKKVIKNGSWPGCATKEMMAKVEGFARAKDEEAFAKFMLDGELNGSCTVFSEGEKVFLVEGEVFSGLAKVRREGEIVEYWIAREAFY